MANTSATGGYLQPTSTPPLDDDALIDFIQAWVAGITGISGTLIRPRWQAEPANIPPFGTNWAALGLVETVPDTFAAEIPGVSSATVRRNEELDFLISFYGPNAMGNMRSFLDGIQVAQNREELQVNSMGLISSSRPVVVPELIKEKWVNKVDAHFYIRRKIERTFSILQLLPPDSSSTINNEKSITPL